jgi:DnaJ-class molecular chaperone
MAVKVTQKHTCNQCNGNGEISFPGEGCGDCKGKGYVETLSGEEAVCTSCSGNGYKMSSGPCRDCKGRGFHVSLYEVTDYATPCVPCGGTGRVNEERAYSDFYGSYIEQRQVEFRVCHGKGIITDQRIKRIK